MTEAEDIKEKVNAYKYLTKEQFTELCREFETESDYCKKEKVVISDVQIDTVFQLLDEDDSGTLDHDEIVGVLQGQQTFGQSQDQEFQEQVIKIIQT